MQISVVVEGDADAVVATRLLEFAGHQAVAIHGRRGKGWIDENIAAYNQAARHSSWFVLRDLDADGCPVDLVSTLLPSKSPRLAFRIAVYSIESWLLADRDRISNFLHVSPSIVPLNPDSVQRPKDALVNLARRSRTRAIRDDMAPPDGYSSRVGPAYIPRITEYVRSHWRPSVALRSSRSLERCVIALRRLV